MIIISWQISVKNKPDPCHGLNPMLMLERKKKKASGFVFLQILLEEIVAFFVLLAIYTTNHALWLWYPGGMSVWIYVRGVSGCGRYLLVLARVLMESVPEVQFKELGFEFSCASWYEDSLSKSCPLICCRPSIYLHIPREKPTPAITDIRNMRNHDSQDDEIP